jgi:hypothetical protein
MSTNGPARSASSAVVQAGSLVISAHRLRGTRNTPSAKPSPSTHAHAVPQPNHYNCRSDCSRTSSTTWVSSNPVTNRGRCALAFGFRSELGRPPAHGLMVRVCEVAMAVVFISLAVGPVFVILWGIVSHLVTRRREFRSVFLGDLANFLLFFGGTLVPYLGGLVHAPGAPVAVPVAASRGSASAWRSSSAWQWRRPSLFP